MLALRRAPEALLRARAQGPPGAGGSGARALAGAGAGTSAAALAGAERGGGGLGEAAAARRLKEMGWDPGAAAAAPPSRALLPREAPGPGMLTDRHGRHHSYLRVSLTERCNLRCTYCMPAEGLQLTPREALLQPEELLRLVRLFARGGVSKVRLTGGEPTVRRDLEEVVAALRGVPGVEHVAMTTNGLVLRRDRLRALRRAGLDAMNISLDTLREDRFEATTRRRGHARVLRAIREAAEEGFDRLKVNVVVQRGGNCDEVLDFVGLTRDLPLNVRFIEWMPFDGNVWSDKKMVPYRELRARVEAAFPGRLRRLNDPRGEVAKNFQLDGFRGSVSFITSMTENFCGDCNRIRLMADGNLKACLFGSNEVSLRDAIRAGFDDEELAALVKAALSRKKARHAGMFSLAASKNRAMTHIGG